MRTIPRLALALVLLGAVGLPSFAAGGSKQAGKARSAVERVTPFWTKGRAYVCRRATGVINVDGKLDEPDWKRAGKIALVFPVKRTPATTAAAGRLLYDDTFLYWAVEMEDRDLCGESAGHEPGWGNDDVIELFVKPDSRQPGYWRPGYWEFHVTPLGGYRDYFYARRGAGGEARWLSYESGMRAALKVDGTVNHWEDYDRGWTTEVAIPLSAFSRLAGKPVPGDRWKFLVARYDYSVYLEDGVELSASAFLPKVDFHLYESYPYLVFGK